ncbi:MAG: hypothetical protein K2X08_07240 [Chlamydiales bacterium]|nr:hypothetical protein [Chlamydiales bacterium]
MSINVSYKEISCLQDQDLRILAATSEEMNVLVKKEFEKRNLELEELFSYFVPTRTFNVEKITEARMFLLGESHGDLVFRSVVSKIVHYLARRAFVIFAIEEVPSMEFRDNVFEPVWKDTQHAELQPLLDSFNEPTIKENIHAIGWDAKEKLDPSWQKK